MKYISHKRNLHIACGRTSHGSQLTAGTDWYNCGATHSMSLNANMKAYAAWWLWARLAGWN
ncbi:MAG: hypothetical protein EHM28_10405 [Spirochaetaceae bacterium]|nr:MAG: hypothetical protein EHM28_10405 [Spirochaetaceae bacterium]